MLRSSELAAWLTTLLPTETATISGRPLSGMTDEPDRYISVVREAGLLPGDEGYLYYVAFRIQCRGAQQNHDSAELLADECDDALLLSAMPAQIGAWKALAIAAQSRPSLVTVDAAERSVLSATYAVTVPRI